MRKVVGSLKIVFIIISGQYLVRRSPILVIPMGGGGGESYFSTHFLYFVVSTSKMLHQVRSLSICGAVFIVLKINNKKIITHVVLAISIHAKSLQLVLVDSLPF